MSLFTPLVDENRLHPYFSTICKSELYEQPVKDIINSWSVGLLTRKGERNKFITEFQTTFNTSFWELYLNSCFKKMGWDIDYTKDRPDFYIDTKKYGKFNVEAVTCNAPQKEEITDSLIERETERLAGKILDKKRLFVGYNNKTGYNQLDHVKDNPFVVAISSFSSRNSFMQNNMAINRLLFGIEPPDPNNYLNGGQESVSSMTKQNGSSIPLGIFTNDSYSEISAVIFSTTGTISKAVIESGLPRMVRATKYRTLHIGDFIIKEGISNVGTNIKKLGNGTILFTYRFINKDIVSGHDIIHTELKNYSESIFDGLHIYYNPFATNPLDPNAFSEKKEITNNFYNPEDNSFIMDHNDNSLVSRILL